MPTVRCHNCKAWNDPEETSGYCDECGRKLPPTWSRPRPVASTPEIDDNVPTTVTSSPGQFPVIDPAWLVPSVEVFTSPYHENDLPPPLSDPLRRIRFLLVFGMCVSVILVFLFWTGDVEDYRTVIALGWGGLFMLCLLRILPSRPVNAVYLRSFANDDETLSLRVVAQQGLGWGYRLSGIRDPRKRWSGFVSGLASLLFVFSYSTPKYMNLEAGPHWKARLWRTLGDARCVIIDVSVMTRFVLEEIRLSCTCMGLDRVLFVGSPCGSVEQWRQLVASVLPAGATIEPERIQVAIWEDTHAGRAAFRNRVRAFAWSMPDATAKLNPATLPLALATDLPDGPADTREGSGWIPVILGTIVASALMFGYEWLKIRFEARELPSIFLIPLGIFSLFLVFAMLGYLINCGSALERLLFVSTFGSVFLLPLPVLLVATSLVRQEAVLMSTQNNLKQIGIALHSYHDANGCLPPPASFDNAGKPLLSWRVAILPYIEQGQLYQMFNLDEPWNSPHNIQLLPYMPREYARVGHEDEEPRKEGRTRIQAFVGPGTAFEPIQFVGRAKGLRFTDFEKGTSKTILVAVAREAVPWTKPDDLVYKPDGPLPILGWAAGEPILIGLVDGSVKRLLSGTSDAALRAWIRRDGAAPEGSE